MTGSNKIKRFAVHDGPGIRTTVFKRVSVVLFMVPQSRRI